MSSLGVDTRIIHGTKTRSKHRKKKTDGHVCTSQHAQQSILLYNKINNLISYSGEDFLHILVSLSKKCLSTQTCTLYVLPCVVKSSSVEAVVAVYVHPNHRNYTRCAPNLSRVECLYLVVPTLLHVRTYPYVPICTVNTQRWQLFFRREGSTSAKKKYEHYHSY